MHVQNSLKYRRDAWRRMPEERVVTARIPPADLQVGSRVPSARGDVARTEREELTALIEREYVGLRLTITRKTQDPELAADLLNEAIYTTWQKWQDGKLERPQQVAGYVFAVAMNLLRNHRRAMGVRPSKRASASELDALPASSEPRDEVIEAQLATRVRKLIQELDSERDRTVLVRFYLDEEEKEVICRALSLSSLQFDKVLHRARRRLRELMESRGFSGSDLVSVLIAVAMVAAWRL